MVGSVLMERMQAEGDFEGLDAAFFSTSQAGGEGPTLEGRTYQLADAFDLKQLAAQDVLISCQGSDYTSDVYDKLRAQGWKGYWVDAARTLRMHDDTVLILDSVNRDVIDRGLDEGKLTFCGPNCTVSLLIMALDGLLKDDQVEWVSSMTYQAASGGGAQHMRELVAQWAHLVEATRPMLTNPAATALLIDERLTEAMRDARLPKQHFGYPLAASLLPWIDAPVEGGQTREEWKAFAEGNKILGKREPIPFDGVCVRVGAMRCHAQGVTLKLRRALPLAEIEQRIANANAWVRFVPNEREATLAKLTPAAVSGTLDVAVGRVRTMRMGPEYVSLYTVGDQLLWGAAEPLRRMLRILRERA